MRSVLNCVALILVLVPGVALAGDGVHAPTVTGETGLFTLFTGQTLPRGQWSFGLQYNNWDRTVIRDGGAGLGPQFKNKWDYDFDRLSASVGYGITDKFELSLMVPYGSLHGGDNNRFGRINGRDFVNRIDTDGLANLRLGGKWRLWEEGAKRFAINAFIEAGGDEDQALATGDTGFGAGLAYEVSNWALNLGYRDPGTPSNGRTVSEELLVGVGYAASIREGFDWITELAATIFLDSDVSQDDAYDLTSGGRLWFGEAQNWAFDFALRTNLQHLSDTDQFCPIGGLVGLSFFPRLSREKALAAAKAEEERLAAEAAAKAAEAERLRREEEERKRREEEERKRREEAERRRREAEANKVPPPPPPPPVIEEVCLFASNSTRVDNRCKATLDEVALRMKEDAARAALVIGYTDSTGSTGSNLRMSERRAEAVKSYLVTRHAIDPSRITTEGHGESEAVGDNSSRSGRSENRRARIILRVQ